MKGEVYEAKIMIGANMVGCVIKTKGGLSV